MPVWTHPEELNRAKVLIEEAKRMETRHRSEPLKGSERLMCHALCHAAFVYSVAHAEAWANQLIGCARYQMWYLWGTAEKVDAEPPILAQQALRRLADNDDRRSDALQRWNAILDAFGMTHVDMSRGDGQDFKLCIKVRNRLVHPVPQLFAPPGHTIPVDEEDPLARTVRSALGKRNLPLSPLFDETAPFFPNQFLSSGTAEWAARTSDRVVAWALTSIGIRCG